MVDGSCGVGSCVEQCWCVVWVAVGWNADVPRDKDVLVRADGRRVGEGVKGGGEVVVVVVRVLW